jgi:hypothetical protein
MKPTGKKKLVGLKLELLDAFSGHCDDGIVLEGAESY